MKKDGHYDDLLHEWHEIGFNSFFKEDTYIIRAKLEKMPRRGKKAEGQQLFGYI